MKTQIISWILRLVIVVILGQTLFYKFTDHPETVELFAKLDMGAFGYRLIGFLELIACILLLIPSSVAWGALLAWGLMSGALMAHITKIGFEGEMGVLAGMAAIAWIFSILIMYIHRAKLPVMGTLFKSDRSKSELNS